MNQEAAAVAALWSRRATARFTTAEREILSLQKKKLPSAKNRFAGVANDYHQIFATAFCECGES